MSVESSFAIAPVASNCSSPRDLNQSFPMHHPSVTTNYPWLPHNLDPSIETPDEYREMPIQPLGDKQAYYDNLIQGCVDHFGKMGSKCLDNERDRIRMAIRQPQVSGTRFI